MTDATHVTPRFKDSGARKGRHHDDAHLAAIRLLPCLVCRHHAPSEAAHIRLADLSYGVEWVGMAVKPHDWLTVPLCDAHHRTGRRAEHRVGTRNFWKLVGLDPIGIAKRLYDAKGYDAKMAVLLEVWTFEDVRDPNV